MTHNTTECRRFNKYGSQKDRLTTPFDSAKKPWNKPGSGDHDQITYLTEEIAKLKKKLKKSKKHSKKQARESSDNDSNDNLDNGSSSTSGPVDKRFKSTDSRGIAREQYARQTLHNLQFHQSVSQSLERE